MLWGARAEGVTAVEVARRIGRRRPPASSAGDVLLAVNGVAGRDAGRRRRVSAPRPRRARGSPTRCCGSARSRRSQVALAPAPRGGSMYFVLAAVGLFTLLVGASVRLRRPRDQATLHFFWLCVAFFGVVHLLVQRPVRSARLGLLLGRRGRDGAAAAAAAALHAGVSRSAPRRGGVAAAPSALVAADVPAGARARRGRVVAVARGSRDAERRAVLARARHCSIALEPVYLFVCAVGGAGRAGARASARSRSVTGAAPAALDRVGHGARRRAVRVRLRAAVGARRRSAAGAAAHRHPARPRAADLRVGDRPLPAARRRSHRQARRSPTPRSSPPAWRSTSRCCKLVGFVFAERRRSAQLDRRAAGDAGRRAAGAAGEGGGAERARSRVLPRSLRLPPRAGRRSRAI